MVRKSLVALKNDLKKIQKEIVLKENKLKMELGGEVLAKTGVSSLSEFKNHYTVVKIDIEPEAALEGKK